MVLRAFDSVSRFAGMQSAQHRDGEGDLSLHGSTEGVHGEAKDCAWSSAFIPARQRYWQDDDPRMSQRACGLVAFLA